MPFTDGILPRITLKNLGDYCQAGDITMRCCHHDSPMRTAIRSVVSPERQVSPDDISYLSLGRGSVAGSHDGKTFLKRAKPVPESDCIRITV